MTAESQVVDAPTPPSVAPEAAGRGRSTIEFSYFDLAGAIEIAHAVKHIGGTSADWKQLAVKLTMSPDGGGFRARVMSGKAFGILDYSRGTVELTELGLRIVDPQFERAARVDAFMAVPLHKALFDRLNGQTLPPPPAIERMAEQLGVAPKQKDKARLAFIRSAKQAGLFELATDRLSLPPGLHTLSREKVPAAPVPVEQTIAGGGGGSGGGSDDLHPFIKGLLQKLPEPETEWSVEGRAKWLTTAMNIFDLMYSSAQDSGSKVIFIEVKTI